MGYIGPIVIAVLLAVAIYRNATNRVDRYGRAPWRWPVAVWTVLTVLLGLIAALVYLFAGWRQDSRMRVARPS